MPQHGCHALPSEIVIDRQRLVRARRGRVKARSVQGHFDQRAVFARGAFEGSEKKIQFISKSCIHKFRFHFSSKNSQYSNLRYC